MGKKKKKTSKKKLVDYTNQDRKTNKYPWLSVLALRVMRGGGYYDSEGVIHNGEGCIRCTSMVKATGKRCNNFATVGETTCHIHGGQLARAKAGKQRIYSAFIEDARLRTVYERAQEDEELTGIREELSLLRTLLAKAVGDGTDYNLKDIKNVSSIVGEIRQLVKDCTVTEIRLGQLIDIGKVTIIVGQLAKIIQKYVTDPEVLEKIAKEFDNIIWPAASATTPQPSREEPLRALPEAS